MSDKRTKYGSTKVTVDGLTFDSKKEATVYGKLKLLKRAGEILDFELQPEYEYQVNYTTQFSKGSMTVKRKYIADFRVYFNDEHEEVWDVKGFKTAIYKQKKKIIEKLYGIKIIEK